MTSVLVTIEQRFDRTPDGAIWGPQFDYPFWTRYLEAFDGVRVVARMREVSRPAPSNTRCDGPGVEFLSVPYYVGPAQYLARFPSVHRAVRSSLRPKDAVILRVDSQLAVSLERPLWSSRRPYGVEVVVDPYDAFAPGSIEHPLRAFFRHWFVWRTREQVARASAAAYVTHTALQERYPARSATFSTHFSSVELDDAAFVPQGRREVCDVSAGPVTLVMVALLDQLRKGQHVVMRAMRHLTDAGVDSRFVLVGDGSFRGHLEQLARELGLCDRVVFAGQLDRAGVRRCLDSAHVFVMPSQGEGLPRAAIEAMARGLPVIGSQIGGFRELVDEEFLVPPRDPVSLAAKLRWLIGSPTRMNEASAANLTKAREYHRDVLAARRHAFYSALRDQTEAFWTRSGSST
jgi:phosphatidylinositol alpha-1,6-mannosyltransferase